MQLSQYCSSSMDSPTSKNAICVGASPQYTQNFLFMDNMFILFSAGITNGSISRAFLPSVTIFLTYLHDRELLRIAARFFEKFHLENAYFSEAPIIYPCSFAFFHQGLLAITVFSPYAYIINADVNFDNIPCKYR